MTVFEFPFDFEPDLTTPQEVGENLMRRLLAGYSVGGWVSDPSSLAGAVTALGDGSGVSINGPALAVVQGYGSYLDDDEPVLVGAAETNPRIDRLVVRLSRNAKTCRPFLIPGSAAASPAAPAVTRDIEVSGIWDLYTAQVRRASISQGAGLTITPEHDYAGSDTVPCTSTNRPKHMRLGGLAYETDTGKLIQWIGTWRTVFSPADADTGQVVLPPPPGGYVNAWAADPTTVQYVRRRGGWVHLHMAMIRQATTLARNDGESNLTTIPSGFRPPANTVIRKTAYVSSFNTAEIEVRPNGIVNVRESHADITPGRYVYIDLAYLAL